MCAQLALVDEASSRSVSLNLAASAGLMPLQDAEDLQVLASLEHRGRDDRRKSARPSPARRARRSTANAPTRAGSQNISTTPGSDGRPKWCRRYHRTTALTSPRPGPREDARRTCTRHDGRRKSVAGRRASVRHARAVGDRMHEGVPRDLVSTSSDVIRCRSQRSRHQAPIAAVAARPSCADESNPVSGEAEQVVRRFRIKLPRTRRADGGDVGASRRGGSAGRAPASTCVASGSRPPRRCCSPAARRDCCTRSTSASTVSSEYCDVPNASERPSSS